ncbi:hypothetical protein [Zavarzinella formosa]|uniref:hypothetical protein n=1 Tax=Zavarzinella formosa TaxID=360055 RepID=UPI0002ED2200|nr:hypothetical protein [Zavarzinella formosa]
MDEPPNPNEDLAARIRSGRLMAFVRRDLFTVQLDDGITITAVMPEELFPIYDPNVRLTVVNRPSVEVEMRESPALPRIIAARPSSFCGPGY